MFRFYDFYRFFYDGNGFLNRYSPLALLRYKFGH